MRIAGKTIGLVAPACIAALLAALTACSGADKSEEVKKLEPEAVKPELVPPLPVELAPLDRAQILAAVGRAADAAFRQAPPSPDDTQLVGRNFELRLPFGCDGPDSGNWGRWTFDSKRQTLKVSASSQEWKGTALGNALLPEEGFDALEGFWLERPWTISEDCPKPVPQQAGAPEGSKAKQTVGIAQLLASDAPRNLRRAGRPYSISQKLEAEPAAGQSYRIVLKGRIGAFPNGDPVRCQVTGNATPPVCLIAAEFSSVALEDGSTGESLADWKY